MPAVIASLYLFRFDSLRVITLSIAFAVTWDGLAQLAFGGKDHTTNWSSALLGLLFGLLLPVNAPWWLILLGSFIMIIIGKKLFGGLGAYPVHPVALSYAMLMISWPTRFDYTSALIDSGLGVTMVEPMRLVRTLGSTAQAGFQQLDLFWGRQVAGTGNAMVFWLLLGGLFLLLMRQIRWQIPTGFLAGFWLSALLLHMVDPIQFATPTFQLLAGSTVLAALFLATDHTTSPINSWPQLLYGVLGGIILVLIRSFSSYHDGVVFTILLMNICAPLLDRITPRTIYRQEVGQDA